MPKSSSPRTVGMPELGQITGLSRERIRHLISLGLPHHTRPGTRGESWSFDTSQVFQWALSFVRGGTGDVEGEAIDLTAARACLATLQADHQEIKNAQLRDELVPLAEVERALDKAFGAVRAKLLALPTRAAPLVRPDAPTAAFRILTPLVAEMMAELARMEILPDDEPEPAVDAA